MVETTNGALLGYLDAELNSLRRMAEAKGYGLLGYLVGMAEIEVRELANTAGSHRSRIEIEPSAAAWRAYEGEEVG